MAKRRTKKQKETAIHQFSVDWTKLDASSETGPAGQTVKGQKPPGLIQPRSKKSSFKNTNNKALSAESRLIKRDIVKSVSLAGLILSLELVLYLITN